MKTLGIIGGTGPESTIDYYRSLIATYRQRVPDGSYPRIIINSVDNQKLLALVGAKELATLFEYFLAELWRLKNAGADFGLLAANTSHIIFDELERESPIPLLSIVEATCAAARATGLRRLALFGTRFTMQGKFYPRVFEKAGLALVRPESADQDYIHDKYMSELIPGVFLAETRAGLLAIVDRMKRASAIDSVILGGTELALILRDPAHDGIPFLNTSKIHVEAAVERMLD
ncbi:MAG: amino acid racemase [Verrucomicrobiota bacterium]|nr:amino acid racemase [Verrucomicrobiota bacterium]